MRIDKNRNNNSKKVKNITISAIIAALLLGGVAYALISPSSPFYIGQKAEDNPENTVDYNKPSDGQKKAGDEAKQQFNEEKYPTKEQEAETPHSNTAVAITSSQVSEEALSIRAIVNGADVTGKCTLNMIRGERLVSRVAETQLMGSYYICKGFDIPKTELDMGEWTFTIKYSDMNGSSESQVQKVTIS